MSYNRKDNKGRVLHKGESQRKDGLYQYRYTDVTKKRSAVYAKTLNALREKEVDISKRLNAGISLSESNVTVVTLLNEYLKIKLNLRNNTIHLYKSAIKSVERSELGNMPISKVKSFNIQSLIVSLYSNDGKTYGTINSLYVLLRQAFEKAYQDGILPRNPCSFRLSDVIQNNNLSRAALTPEQQESLLSFTQQDIISKPLYDIVVIFLETGLRVSEFCGLTLNDIDLESRKISVNHQLLRVNNKGLIVSPPKSSSGNRMIPMSKLAYEGFKNLIANRQKPINEPKVDGYSKFLLLTEKGNPYLSTNLDKRFDTLKRRYNKACQIPITKLSPHILRHTFCSNLVLAGANITITQYLMGHADVSTTLNTYTHTTYEAVVAELARIGK